MNRLSHEVLLLLCLSLMLTSCVEQSKSKLEGYEWVEGKWESNDYPQVYVKVTPQYYQFVGELWDEDMNLNNAEKKDYSIQIESNEYLGDIKGIIERGGAATIYIDEGKKSLYWIYDFDQKVYLTKNTDE